jgi:hypothetical protein
MESTDCECGICLDVMQQHMTENLSCGHKFCTSCIGKWAECHNTCPNCRSNIRTGIPQNIVNVSSDVGFMTQNEIDRFERNEYIKHQTDIMTIVGGMIGVPIMMYICSLLENSI